MTENMNMMNTGREAEPTETKHRRNQNAGKKQLLRRCFLILVGVILGLNLYVANARTLLGNSLPMPFGYGLANVLSGSMEPAFSKGTLLAVKKTRDIQPGDIVVYQSEKELIVHRVRAINGDEVITQGDANTAADEPFEKSRIKGKVIGWIPVLGSIAALLKTPAAVIIILLFAFILVEGSFRKQKDADEKRLDTLKAEIWRLKTEIEETKKRDDKECIEDTDNAENKSRH